MVQNYLQTLYVGQISAATAVVEGSEQLSFRTRQNNKNDFRKVVKAQSARKNNLSKNLSKEFHNQPDVVCKLKAHDSIQFLWITAIWIHE